MVAGASGGAAGRPNHPFLVWEPFGTPGRTWTYTEFAHDVAAVAEGLRRRGVGAGDVVLIHLENCLEFLLGWFACARLGVVAVCTNTRSSQDELNYFGGHSGASVVITQPSLASLASNAVPDAAAYIRVDRPHTCRQVTNTSTTRQVQALATSSRTAGATSAANRRRISAEPTR